MTDRKSVLIWIKTVCHSDSFLKVNFENVSRRQQKHEKLPSMQRGKDNQFSQNSKLCVVTYDTTDCTQQTNRNLWSEFVTIWLTLLPWSPCAEPPEKSQKYRSRSPENHKTFKPAFIGMPAKCHLNGVLLAGQ